MPWIEEAWLQDALAALKATCDVDAHTHSEMIQFLLDNGFWDQEKLKDWISAVAKFNSCFNPNKVEFFKIGELWALMRRFGRHQLFLAMAASPSSYSSNAGSVGRVEPSSTALHQSSAAAAVSPRLAFSPRGAQIQCCSCGASSTVFVGPDPAGALAAALDA